MPLACGDARRTPRDLTVHFAAWVDGMGTEIRILLVQTDLHDAPLLEPLLASEQGNFSVAHSTTLCDAKERLHDEHFDVVLLDIDSADSNGFDTLNWLRSNEPTMPVVVLTDVEDERLAIKTIRAGAQDYLSKRHLVGPLLCRVIRHSIARQKQLRYYKDAALTDGLTGLANRRSFDAELGRRLADWRRNQAGFSLLLVDIDHFKLFNDRRGHLAGDRVLRDVAAMLSRSVRQSDLLTRFGGDEFGIILPSSNLSDAQLAAERSRTAIMAYIGKFKGKPFRVTVSVGVAEVEDGDDASRLISRADEALYAAKNNERNCCFANDGTGRFRINAWRALQKKTQIVTGEVS
jgi:diguanylate cyclase (GGDEF)-like protein